MENLALEHQSEENLSSILAGPEAASPEESATRFNVFQQME